MDFVAENELLREKIRNITQKIHEAGITEALDIIESETGLTIDEILLGSLRGHQPHSRADHGDTEADAGDLISREETLKAVTDAVGSIVEKAFYSTLSIPELREAIDKTIKERPTAYDVEKVMEQVDELWKRPVFGKAELESVIRKGGKE